MDNYKPKDGVEEKSARRGGAIGAITRSINDAIGQRRLSREAPIYDGAAFLAALIFSRTHIIFGAHPLGLGLLTALSSRVWMATLGAAVGALTMGGAGVLYAMVSLIAVFLRVIVSGGGKNKSEGGAFFRESLPLRMSSAVIAGFVAAVYEVLLGGITVTTVLYGASMVLISPLATLVLYGFLDTGIPLRSLLFDSSAFFTAEAVGKQRRTRILFQASALCVATVMGLSLREYELLGISAAYVFGGIVTLVVSRRFGSLRGAAVGFFSLLGISAPGAVAFALLGIALGILFRMGAAYALLGGGIVLVGWCTYSDGVVGMLTVLPEYVISALLVTPFLKKIPLEKSEREEQNCRNEAADMVGTVALSYKNKCTASLDSLERTLEQMSDILRKSIKPARRPRPEELRELIFECIDRYCRSCDGYSRCVGEQRYISEAELDRLASRLYDCGSISSVDIQGISSFCERGIGVCETVNRAYAMLCADLHKEERLVGGYEELAEIGRLLGEARLRDLEDRSVNESLSAGVEKLLASAGITNGIARVFGERRLHFIIAGEDPDGTRISSPELLSSIEELCNCRLGVPEYCRRGNMALMECGTRPRFAVQSASAGFAGEREAVSGDTVRLGESADGCFTIILSDGMGSGQCAKETSELVVDLISKAQDMGAPGRAVIGMLNSILRRRRTECSATLDLLRFDLYGTDSYFIKSGSALSYVKRQSSIFRIASRTAPLGLMKTPDAERIRVELNAGDYVIMMSDGLLQGAEDAPWLLELISRAKDASPTELVEKILACAKKNLPPADDMTVAVAKITELARGA